MNRTLLRWCAVGVLLLAALPAWAQAPTWEQIEGGATDIAANGKGHLWVIGGDGLSIYRRDGSKWTLVPGGASRVAVGPDGTAWVINSARNIFRWNGSGWTLVPGAAIDVGIGKDGSVWVLGTNGVPHRFENGNWKMYDGVASSIAVDSKGQPWVVNANGDIFYRDWTKGWQQLDGKAKDIAVGDDDAVYVVGGGAGPGGNWFHNRATGRWAAETHAGVRVAAGPPGTAYVAKDASAGYAIWKRSLPAGATWAQVAGGGTDIGAGANGSVWLVSTETVPGGYAIYWRDGANWTKVPGGVTRIAVGPDGVPWAINNTKNIFKWNGSTWGVMPGAAIDVGIGKDGSVWVLGTNGVPHRFENGNWKMYDGVASSIAVDSKGQPWVVNANGNIFYRDWTKGWQQLDGLAKDIAVDAADGVYVIGAGGGTVHKRVNGAWQPESQAGARIAAGADGVAWVVKDQAANWTIWARSPGAAAPVAATPTLGDLNLVGTEQILVQPTTTPTATTPERLVITGLAPFTESYPSNAPKGQVICPILENGRLKLGCDFKKSSALYLGKAPNCPSGAFVDPRNGGECWSCPSGFIRNVSPVTADDACWKAVSEDLQRATLVKSTGCPGGTFHDPRNGGECWSCPSGFNRTWDPVTAGTACSQSWVGPFSSATYHGKPGGACDGSSFFDPRNGGECWKCPDGYRRTLHPVTDWNACAQTIPTQYSKATFEEGCGKQPPPFGYGPPFRDPRNDGECWTCPLQFSRSLMAVTLDSACVIGGGNNSIYWQLPQYPDPGVQRFVDGVVQEAFRDAKQIDAFLNKRAGGDAARKAALWAKMANEPNDSPEFKAIVFTALVKAAKTAPAGSAAERSVAAFQSYVRNRRTFIAKEAAAMYDHWSMVNAKNMYDAARATLGGFAGIGANVLGATPGDFSGIANQGTGPDARGAAFYEAFTALGMLANTQEFQASSSVADDGFDPTIVIGVWDGIMKALDIKDFVELVQVIRMTSDLKPIAQSGGGAAAAAAGGVVLGVQLARQMVELGFAISVLVDQQEAQNKINQAVTEAQQAIVVKDILASGTPEQKSMLAQFWAMGTSPYKAGPTAGAGTIADADFCNAANTATYNVDSCNALQLIKRTVDAARATLPAATTTTAPTPSGSIRPPMKVE